MITKLVSNDNNSFKLLLCYVFLEDTKYMTILTRHEREKLVLDLYNQGKTYREIAKEARISPRDIGVILNKAIEEKTGGLKDKGQDDAEKNRQQEEQHLSLAAQAYKLFSERKTPLEVAIALNLKESEATKFYKEYWKLKQLHDLNMVYEETKGDIEPFLRLYRLSKAAGMSARHVTNLLKIANTDLPDIQCRYERLKREVSTLEFNKQQSHIALSYFNNKIATQRKALTSYSISCIRERREIGKLCNEKSRLEAVVNQFKNNNEEYLDNIKQAAEDKVKDVLTDCKLILKFATLSVMESLRSNPELYNFISYSNSDETASANYGSNYPSLMSGRQQQQSFNDSYTALILEEAEKFYNKLTKELTNGVIAAAVAIRASSLP
jgi:transposase